MAQRAHERARARRIAALMALAHNAYAYAWRHQVARCARARHHIKRRGTHQISGVAAALRQLAHGVSSRALAHRVWRMARKQRARDQQRAA